MYIFRDNVFFFLNKYLHIYGNVTKQHVLARFFVNFIGHLQYTKTSNYALNMEIKDRRLKLDQSEEKILNPFVLISQIPIFNLKDLSK